MTIYSLPSMTPCKKLPEGCVVALGFFDGVHLGHRRIIDTARLEAENRKSEVAVWMIAASDPCYKRGSPALTDEAEKLSLLHAAGAAYAAVQDFSEVRGLSGEAFVRDILKTMLTASCAVCGFNFRFGNGASCGVSELRAYSNALGIDTVVSEAVTDGSGETISSSRIRRLISEGDVNSAALLLGRPYSFSSAVLEGKKLGRRLGFPTANQLIPEGRQSPENGVYAVEVSFVSDGVSVSYPGAANVGVCPTLTGDVLSEARVTPQDLESLGAAGGNRRVCETYILGYSGDLYGCNVKVAFLDRLRGEKSFDGIDALTAQIRRDAEAAERIFCDIYGTLRR